MLRFTLLALVIASALTTAFAQEYVPAPPGGKPVIADVAGQVKGNGTKIQVVPVQGQSFTQAVRMTSTKPGQAWDLAFTAPIPADIAKGEAYLLGYWVRSISTRHESGQGMVSVEVAEADAPWRKVTGNGVAFPKDWVHYWVAGSAPVDMKKGTASLKVTAGEEAQTLEIGGIEVLSYGVGYDAKKLPRTRLTYLGREADAPWRKAAQERIEKLRMAPLQVNVVGRDGKSIANAGVKIEQVSSTFGFGIEFSPDHVLDQSKPENEQYRKRVLDMFNTIVYGNSLKWEARVGDWGFGPKQTMAALKWAKDNGLSVRGHNMVWPGGGKNWNNLPKFIRDMKDKPDGKAIQELVLSRIDEVSEATAGYIDEWDVMNEPRDNHALIDLCGKQAMADWFKRARERLPNVRLAVNEYSILTSLSDSPTLDIYEGYIKDIQKNGGPLDVIGMQGYFGTLVPTPERMLKTLDRFGALGPKIRVTEYSMSGDDEELVADFTRDLITVLYSHPSAIGFTTWHGITRFVNADGSLTKLGQVYCDLVLKQLRTNTQLKTNSEGTCEVRGHLGRYRITATTPAGTREQWLDLRPDSPAVIVTVP